MNTAHLEILTEMYQNVSPHLTRSDAVTDFHEVRNWFGPAKFDKLMEPYNARELCMVIDTLLHYYRQGEKADTAMSEIVLAFVKHRYKPSTLEKFEKWMQPKEVAKPAQRPSFNNVVSLHR